jgi:hypothetical protein
MSASSIVARSAGNWKRVRVQSVFCSSVSSILRVKGRAVPTLSGYRAASTLSPATARNSNTALNHNNHNNNSINRWRCSLDYTGTASCRQYSSALPSNTDISSFDSPNADVEVDSGAAVPESHVVVSKEDEKLEENKRRRLSEVRYCYAILYLFWGWLDPTFYPCLTEV